MLSIPERYQYGVSKIRDLDMDTVRALRAVLDKFAFSKQQKGEVVSAAVSALQSVAQPLPADDFGKISDALISMYSVKSGRDVSLEEFCNQVADALTEISSPELRLAPEDTWAFTEKLKILLGAEPFEVFSKLSDLRAESERVFCHARIITDLRPVFGSDVAKGPAAVLVAHNLKIAYHESGRKNDHDFFVSLDAQGLRQLKEVILRAEEKVKTMRAMVNPEIGLFGTGEVNE